MQLDQVTMTAIFMTVTTTNDSLIASFTFILSFAHSQLFLVASRCLTHCRCWVLPVAVAVSRQPLFLQAPAERRVNRPAGLICSTTGVQGPHCRLFEAHGA